MKSLPPPLIELRDWYHSKDLGTYSAHVSEARDLEGHEEHATIEEEQVAFPAAGVVVGFNVYCLGDRQNGCSCHYCTS